MVYNLLKRGVPAFFDPHKFDHPPPMTSKGCFNIRVYGLCIVNDHLLLSDEYRLGMYMTKFPGGGLEYGEGPIECLQRECFEEMGLEIKVTGHFYTTDFFQETRFFDHTQLISIYYTFDLPQSPPLLTTQESFPFGPKEGNQSFRWISLDMLSPEDLTFPIDRKVAQMIKEGLSF